MARTNIRLYFFDMGRPKGEREMREHPANGMPFAGTNRMAVDASGEYIQGTHLSVEGISPRARAAGIGKPGRLNHEVSVTRSDFPEAQGVVKVKIWGPAKTMWAELRDDEPGGTEALERKVAQSKIDHPELWVTATRVIDGALRLPGAVGGSPTRKEAQTGTRRHFSLKF